MTPVPTTPKTPTVPVRPPVSPATPLSPVTPPMTPVNTGVVVQGPGFEYAIIDKNFTPSSSGSLENEKPNYQFEPLVRYISVSNSVKVRSTPDNYSFLIDILPRNSRVMLVAVEGEWGKIEANGRAGWVALEYLRSLQDSDLARTDVHLFDKGYVPSYPVTFNAINTYSVNLRTGPGTYYSTHHQLFKGDIVVVLETIGLGWIEVRSSRGTIGYIQDKWIK